MTKAVNFNTKRQTYIIVIILMLLFAIPITLSWSLYYGNIHLHWGSVNNGYLFKQPLQLKQLSIKMIDGIAVSESPESDKWNILYLNAEGNAPQPLRILDKLYRVRLALGKDFSRVKQSYAFSYQPLAKNLNQSVSEHFQQVTQLAIADNSIRQLLYQIPQVKAEEAIFIIDPHGNVMLGYQPDVKPKDIYSDLERLLKYSNIG